MSSTTQAEEEAKIKVGSRVKFKPCLTFNPDGKMKKVRGTVTEVIPAEPLNELPAEFLVVFDDNLGEEYWQSCSIELAED